MPLIANLTGLDKSAARFRGLKVDEIETEYYGQTKVTPVYDVNVTINKETWEGMGSPRTVEVSVIE